MPSEGLGRAFNVVPIAAGVGLSLKESEAVTFVCTGSDTFTVTTATTFGGTYRAGSFFTPAWAPIVRLHKSTATGGTAAWTLSTITAADNTGAQTNVTVFTIFGNSLPDTYAYIKCSVGASGLVTAILHDLKVQKKPAQMTIVAA
jgi:hypothetical protein